MSERKGLGKTEKSRWCSGVAVLLWCSKFEGRGSIPGWTASSFRLVPEWKKLLGRIEKLEPSARATRKQWARLWCFKLVGQARFPAGPRAFFRPPAL